MALPVRNQKPQPLLRSTALNRISAIPFEIAIASLLILSGVTGLLHIGVIDPVSALLPSWEAVLLNWASVLSGGFIVTGIVFGRSNVERSGLFFLIGVVVSRFLLYGHLFSYGANFVETGLFYLTIIWAAVIRIMSTAKKQTLIRVHDDNISQFDQ